MQLAVMLGVIAVGLMLIVPSSVSATSPYANYDPRYVDFVSDTWCNYTENGLSYMRADLQMYYDFQTHHIFYTAKATINGYAGYSLPTGSSKCLYFAWSGPVSNGQSVSVSAAAPTNGTTIGNINSPQITEYVGLNPGGVQSTSPLSTELWFGNTYNYQQLSCVGHTNTMRQYYGYIGQNPTGTYTFCSCASAPKVSGGYQSIMFNFIIYYSGGGSQGENYGNLYAWVG
jgi:hypothetical protein